MSQVVENVHRSLVEFKYLFKLGKHHFILWRSETLLNLRQVFLTLDQLHFIVESVHFNSCEEASVPDPLLVLVELLTLIIDLHVEITFVEIDEDPHFVSLDRLWKRVLPVTSIKIYCCIVALLPVSPLNIVRASFIV